MGVTIVMMARIETMVKGDVGRKPLTLDPATPSPTAPAAK